MQHYQKLVRTRVLEAVRTRDGHRGLELHIGANGVTHTALKLLRKQAPPSVTIVAEEGEGDSRGDAAGSSGTDTDKRAAGRRLDAAASKRGSPRTHMRSFFKCVRVCDGGKFGALLDALVHYDIGTTNGGGKDRRAQVLRVDPALLDGPTGTRPSTSPMGGGGITVDDCVFTNAVEAKCAADMVNLRTRRPDGNQNPAERR